MVATTVDDVAMMRFRMPRSVLAAYKRRYRETYPEHGLSFNRWMVALLQSWLDSTS